MDYFVNTKANLMRCGWRQTRIRERNSHIFFRKELEEEWPLEFSEFTKKKVFDAATGRTITGIKLAYITGYMTGKGWLFIEELSDFNLYLGDSLADYIHSISKKSKVTGIALASAFTRVSAEGTQSSFVTGRETEEFSVHDVLCEILRNDGMSLVRKSMKNPFF
jgi:hypothetical protein